MPEHRACWSHFGPLSPCVCPQHTLCMYGGKGLSWLTWCVMGACIMSHHKLAASFNVLLPLLGGFKCLNDACILYNGGSLSCCRKLCYHFVLLFINSRLIPLALIFFPSPFLTVSNSFISPLLHVHLCYCHAALVRHALLLGHQMVLWHIFLGGRMQHPVPAILC